MLALNQVIREFCETFDIVQNRQQKSYIVRKSESDHKESLPANLFPALLLTCVAKKAFFRCFERNNNRYHISLKPKDESILPCLMRNMTVINQLTQTRIETDQFESKSNCATAKER